MKMKGIKKEDIYIIILEVFMLCLSLIVIIPLMIMILGSFKDSQQASLLNLQLPEKWYLENYVIVFQKGKLARAITNSVILTFSSVLLNVLSASLAAFYLARIQSKFNNKLAVFFTLGLISPISMIPTIRLLQWINLNNTFVGVILIYVALKIPFSVFIFIGFIKTIPKEMDEAGIIDGCGPIQLFFRIVFPLLGPVIATASIIVFMGVWNDINIPLYMLNRSEKWTLPLTVYHFFGEYSRDWNLVFADLVITSIPVAIVYMAGQKYITSGLTAGAIKG